MLRQVVFIGLLTFMVLLPLYTRLQTSILLQYDDGGGGGGYYDLLPTALYQRTEVRR